MRWFAVTWCNKCDRPLLFMQHIPALSCFIACLLSFSFFEWNDKVYPNWYCECDRQLAKQVKLGPRRRAHMHTRTFSPTVNSDWLLRNAASFSSPGGEKQCRALLYYQKTTSIQPGCSPKVTSAAHCPAPWNWEAVIWCQNHTLISAPWPRLVWLQ